MAYQLTNSPVAYAAPDNKSDNRDNGSKKDTEWANNGREKGNKWVDNSSKEDNKYADNGSEED
ncbi:MAG: hypothetical protein M1815_005292, partial [Lichina confinis]